MMTTMEGKPEKLQAPSRAKVPNVEKFQKVIRPLCPFADSAEGAAMGVIQPYSPPPAAPDGPGLWQR